MGTDARPSDSDGDRAANTSSGLLDLPSVAAARRPPAGRARRRRRGRHRGRSAQQLRPGRRQGHAGTPRTRPPAGRTPTPAPTSAERRRRELRSLDRQIRALDATIRRLNDSGQGGSAAELRRQRAELAFAALGRGRPGRGGPARPRAPRTRLRGDLIRNVLLGLLAGAILGVLLAYLLERLDRRLKSLEELEEVYELPILARIPRSRTFSKRGRRGRDEALSKTLGFSEEAEAFRSLRTNLRYFNVDGTSKSVLVVSPVSGDGKSTIARYLAITMASMGDSVVLVDADLRKQDSGVAPAEDGLSLVLAGFELDQALTEVPITYDAVSQESRMLVEMPSGPLPPNPSELLESGRMRWVIAQLQNRFDYVIIDSPALMTVSDALSLVPQVSSVLVVGGFEHTTRRAAEALRKQLSLLQARPLGVVANFFVVTEERLLLRLRPEEGEEGKKG